MIKKSLALLFSGMLLTGLVFSGCGGSSSSSSSDGSSADSVSASAESEDSSGGADAAGDESDNLSESKALLEEAIATLVTTDGHATMEAGLSFDIPEISYTEEELEDLDEFDADKWHYYEYIDWNTDEDAELPESPADGCKGKHIILIVHGAHAWTTCYQEAFEQCCEALGMTVDVYDPNWDQSTQDAYIDQAINEEPDAIALIPVSADHATQQFKKITDAGIPAFCTNTTPEASAMNYIVAFTGANDWYQNRQLANFLGESLGGEGGVCYITHTVGGSPYYARYYGPVLELAQYYPDIVNLDVQSPGFEAASVKQVVSDWITKFGDSLNAIYLADDSDQAIGAVEAVTAAGRDDILIVAPGISTQGAELIASGDVFAESYQSCQNDAGLCVRTIAEWFNGEDVPRVQYLSTDMITEDNVDDFTPCQW